MTGKSRSVDCVIAGGGLLGLLTGRLLSREGLSVAVFDKGGMCRESSWAGGGILSPLVPWQYPDAVTELVRWSQHEYPRLTTELLESTGIDPEWRQSGLLMVDTLADASISAWSDRHHCRIQALDAGAVHELEPALSPAAGASLLLPDVAQLRNPRLCRALVTALRSQGVDLHEHAAVTGLSVRQGVIQGVTTATGTVAAGRVVIAGGAWSSRILKGYGTPLPVTPVRGQMILFQAPPGLVRHIVLREGYYLVPRQDGLVLAGSTLEYVGYDKQTTEDAREILAARARELVPALAGYGIAKHWAGLRPGTSTGVPYICEHPEISGLYLNTGHFRNGVVMAPASAQLLLDCLLGRAGFTGLEPYRFLPGDGRQR